MHAVKLGKIPRAKKAKMAGVVICNCEATIRESEGRLSTKIAAPNPSKNYKNCQSTDFAIGIAKKVSLN
jgi:hypothetical protein